MENTTTAPRRGPGRPKDPNKRKMYSFRITDENRAYLQSQPREAGELINRLLADHREKQIRWPE